jgi:hypothetical protein
MQTWGNGPAPRVAEWYIMPDIVGPMGNIVDSSAGADTGYCPFDDMAYEAYTYAERLAAAKEAALVRARAVRVDAHLKRVALQRNAPARQSRGKPPHRVHQPAPPGARK